MVHDGNGERMSPASSGSPASPCIRKMTSEDMLVLAIKRSVAFGYPPSSTPAHSLASNSLGCRGSQLFTTCARPREMSVNICTTQHDSPEHFWKMNRESEASPTGSDEESCSSDSFTSRPTPSQISRRLVRPPGPGMMQDSGQERPPAPTLRKLAIMGAQREADFP